MVKNSNIGRSAILNWVALGISLAVAFLMSPIVVHQLGNVGYGVWTLANSMISYMAVLDLGLRGAVIRFVSRYHAQGDHEESSRAVSAAFWLRLWIGLFIVVVAVFLAAISSSILPIPPEMQLPARWAMVVVGTSFAVTITFGIFGGVLSALHRFDLLSGVNIIQTVLRALGTLWLLKSGYGIVGLAIWELIVVVFANSVLTALCFRVYRELRVFFRRPDSTLLRRLWDYSFYILVLNFCFQIINCTDNLVVGAFVSVGAVTFYTIAGGLFEYTRQMVSALGVTFMPLASSLDAKGRQDGLRRLLIQGTKATLLVALPIEAALFFRGHTFIGLWIGQEYAHMSGQVLQILLVGQVFMIADYTSYNIACGLGRHKPVAMRLIGEAVGNFVLSIVLVQKFGMLGVALGTVIPSIVNHLVLGPRFICEMLDIPVREFIWQSWIRAGFAVTPFAFACYFADRFWLATNMLQFVIQMALLVPVFLLGVGIFFWKDIAEQLPSGRRFIRSWEAGLESVKRS